MDNNEYTVTQNHLLNRAERAGVILAAELEKLNLLEECKDYINNKTHGSGKILNVSVTLSYQSDDDTSDLRLALISSNINDLHKCSIYNRIPEHDKLHIAVLDYNTEKVTLLEYKFYDGYSQEEIEDWLEKLGYNLDEVSYMYSEKPIDVRRSII